jgi:hypothetical protein
MTQARRPAGFLFGADPAAIPAANRPDPVRKGSVKRGFGAFGEQHVVTMNASFVP